KQGRTASAWSEFSSAKQWAERQNQHERAAFAQKHMTAIEARLFSIVFATPTIPGLELLVDGGLLSAAAAGTPLPLDPGDHQVAARAPGYEAWHATIPVPAEAGKITVTVPELKPAPVAATPAATSTAHAQASSPQPLAGTNDEGSTSGAVSRVPMWISLGVAVASVGVGSVFGVLTFSARDAASSECPNNRCIGSGLSDIDRAKTDATVSTIGFGVGIAAVASAVYFGLRDGGHDRPAAASVSPAPRLRVLPGVASGGAGWGERASAGGLTVVGQFD
ncbi:MAG: hypothetical protein JOZ69_16535, partial [Myxococcales bacterium]|nr:hypothetical protein [Myxococcales bacterium]